MGVHYSVCLVMASGYYTRSANGDGGLSLLRRQSDGVTMATAISWPFKAAPPRQNIAMPLLNSSQSLPVDNEY